ncbi:hypothetical protein Vadar_002020 [Vaccinium darrowii]|uniref:Uncharacterized protein n=1 Tax=Vaccinium darrowii TaxID=229202 RepID=A0ACB7YCJ3_9ERIC|nr:hypothetical protein Vadar_002020 [Vaccinium darrowii]
MDSSSDSKPYDSFKSKKILHSSPSRKPSSSKEIAKSVADWSPWSSKTPEKLAEHPCQTRNRRAAFSLKEVREEAAKLQVEFVGIGFGAVMLILLIIGAVSCGAVFGAVDWSLMLLLNVVVEFVGIGFGAVMLILLIIGAVVQFLSCRACCYC